MRSPRHEIRFYGRGIPYLKNRSLKGRLIVIEGPDASGRSTQCELLTSSLESAGHAVLNTGLKRSELVSTGITDAKRSRIVGKRTLALFYAADFADQLENKILPALEAGYVVLADRYIYTLIARNVVRGLDRRWSEEITSFALVPDAVFYLDVSPENLVERVFEKNSSLDYYESGMDIGLSDDMLQSFLQYQRLLREQFMGLVKKYDLVVVDADRPIAEVNATLRARLGKLLTGVA